MSGQYDSAGGKLETKIKKVRKGTVLTFFLFALINTTNNNLWRKGFTLLTLPGHHPSLREGTTRAQEVWNLEAGADKRNTAYKLASHRLLC